MRVTVDPIGEARAAAERGDFESAVAVLRPLAEAGNPEAQFHLGFLAMTECELVSGREAFSLFMRAAEQGHAEAMCEVAHFPEFLSEPFRSPLSDEDSWQWMLRAAEAGSHEAQYNVGAALATGDRADSGVRQDLETAFTWYRRAADGGHIGAQFNLACMLAEGEGCDRDLPGAKAWLDRAIAGGYEHADGLRSYLEWMQAVAIVVDPDFGDGLEALLDRMPVWIADTAANRTAAARARAVRGAPGQGPDHTQPGSLTTFKVDARATPASWCLSVLGTVAGHHDRYSQSPGYSVLEIYGTEPSAELLAALAEYRLTTVTALARGFRVCTADGYPAGSPNDS